MKDTSSRDSSAGSTLRHQLLRDEFRRRRGGHIGTGGLPAIAQRWDHDPADFKDKVLLISPPPPHVVRLALPGSLAVNSSAGALDRR